MRQKISFPSALSTPRPRRLSAATRAWAWESMRGKYGTEAMRTPWIPMDEVPGFEEMNVLDQYDRMILEIARRAPLRLIPAERLSGSATLGAGIWHSVPASLRGKAIITSISHLTLDYSAALTRGVEGYEADIAARLTDDTLTAKQRRFLGSLQNVIEALKIYHARYLEATREAKPEVHALLRQVPMKPARTYHEALQSLWFLFSFVRLTGNWPGLGRLDVLLGPYLERDLKEKRLTLPQARELTASFLIKGTEWIQEDTPPSTGDAQHYQNVVLAGIDENGREVTNRVTYLILDVIEELGISDFPITLRLNENSPARLVRKAAEVIRRGGGVVAVYNESTVLKAMTDFGYPLTEARRFANDGCWETQVPGATYFGYLPFDSLAVLERATLREYGEDVRFESFDALYEAYLKDLEAEVRRQIDTSLAAYFDPEPEYTGWFSNRACPCSVVSLFENDCIRNAASYLDGGTRYRVRSPHIGGFADTVNSLFAIRRLVFEEKRVSFTELMDALRKDWLGREDLRQYVSSAYEYYGNGSEPVDSLAARLLHDFYLICRKADREHADSGFRFPAGVSTFGREIDWLPFRLAAPEGSRKGQILAGNASPTPGTDSQGATAVIRSYTRGELSEMTTGTALDLRLYPKCLEGETGVAALEALIRGFVSLGGYFVQIDAVSPETLRAAREHPEQYKTLSVRVSGWNARFVTLTKEWQDMVIQRAEHTL